jgi:hypothetical protein
MNALCLREKRIASVGNYRHMRGEALPPFATIALLTDLREPRCPGVREKAKYALVLETPTSIQSME